MKLTIVGARSYEFEGSGGDIVKGMVYYAFDEKGKPLEFTSRDESKEVSGGVTSYDSKLAVDLDIQIAGLNANGKFKYREKF